MSTNKQTFSTNPDDFENPVEATCAWHSERVYIEGLQDDPWYGVDFYHMYLALSPAEQKLVSDYYFANQAVNLPIKHTEFNVMKFFFISHYECQMNLLDRLDYFESKLESP